MTANASFLAPVYTASTYEHLGCNPPFLEERGTQVVKVLFYSGTRASLVDANWMLTSNILKQIRFCYITMLSLNSLNVPDANHKLSIVSLGEAS